MTRRPPQEPESGEGFFSRWSRRKALQQEEPVPTAQPAEAPTPAAVTALAPTAMPAGSPLAVAGEPTGSDTGAAQPIAPGTAPGAAPSKPVLTLVDVEKLTAQSDFSVFAAREVDPAVRNAALKKLFHAEPHFNVMDGLDVYIDDYNTPDPLPKAIMRTMLQARALGLLDDELKDQDKPEPDEPDEADLQAHTPSPHEDPDLQLQPHDAAGPEGAGEGLDSGLGIEPAPVNEPRPGPDDGRPDVEPTHG